MIPRKLHYCWFGGGRKPDLVQFCMNSWRQHCPDYEIVEWNEDRFDVEGSEVASEAYRRRKFAFVTDVARAHALHSEGGVYVDSDVEIRRNFDCFLEHHAFSGFQQKGIPFTAVWGSVQGHSFAEKVLDYYSHVDPARVIDTPNTWFTRDILERDYGVDSDRDVRQDCADGMVIYPSQTFCANLPANFSVHHFAGSWLEHETPTHYSYVVLASFYMNALRELEKKGVKISSSDLNLEQEVSFRSDIDRLFWHSSQALSVLRRQARLKLAGFRKSLASRPS